MRLPRHRSRRSGFSLLEVLTALAIFLFAVIGISQLLNVASDRVLETRYTNRAAQLLQSQMNRVIAGEVSLTSQGDTSFDEDPDWTWSIDAASDGSVANLWTVTITVSRARTDGSPFQASLTQMILDPAAKGTLDHVRIELHPELADSIQNGRRADIAKLESEFGVHVEVISSNRLHRPEQEIEWHDREVVREQPIVAGVNPSTLRGPFGGESDPPHCFYCPILRPRTGSSTLIPPPSRAA